MSKQLDWSAIAKVNFDDQRRKATGSLTGKELFAKAFENMQKAETALRQRQEAEPVLRQALLKAMVGREPIRVLHPIQNPTESFGGLQKGEEDDGFYGASPSSENAVLTKKFEEVMETIPAGTELVFKSFDKQLSQFIFKGSNGHDYAIYDRSVIMFRETQIENPGLYGLLFNTSLTDALSE